MQQPAISLKNLTAEEKDRYAAASQQKMKKGITIYIIPFIVMGFLVYYVNMHDFFGIENADAKSWINVGLVFLTILPARLFVNVILRHRKATTAWQKKVFRGEITAKDGNIITIVNQKLKLDKENGDKIKVGDKLIISISTVGDFVFSVEPLENEN